MAKPRSSPALLLMLAVVVTGLLAFVALRPGPDMGAGAESPSPEAREGAAPVDAVPAEAPRRSSDVALPAAGDAPRAVVTGRAVDTSGAPLAALHVTLTSIDEDWLVGAASPRERLDDGREVQGYGATTGDDGRFRLDVPCPTARCVVLEIAARPPLGVVRQEFGEGWPPTPPLAPGAHDLGDLVVSRLGAIEGLVVNAAGAPIAGAVVTCPDVYVRGEHASTRSRADGTFLLAGLPPLRLVGLRAGAEGLCERSAGQVEIPASGVARGVRIMLEEGEPVRGRVVDERDAGVAGVELTVQSYSQASGADVRSAADGRFEARLPAGSAPTVSVRDTRYQQLAFVPGDELVVRVRARPVMTFVVRDAATGAPVERFGLAVGSNDQVDTNPGDTQTPPLGVHPRGELTCVLTFPDGAVRVAAPGYADLDVPVQSDVAGGGRQTLGLRREGRVTGAVTLAGRPLAGATVVLERGQRHPSSTKQAPSLVAEFWGADLRDHEGRPRRVRSGGDGRFLVGGLPEGSWKLRVESEAAAPVEREPLWLRAESALDVGVLDLAPGGALRGVVRTPPGLSPVGVHVDVLGPTPRSLEIERDDGAFLVRGLEPGDYGVQIATGRHLLPQPAGERVRVGAQGVAEVVFDLSARPVCDLRATFTTGGAAVAGARIQGRFQGGPAGAWDTPLGVTDGAGLLRALVPGTGRARFSAQSALGLPLGTSAEFTLPAAGPLECTAEFASGQLSLELPAGTRVPARARLAVLLSLREPAGSSASLFFVTERAGARERSWGGFPASLDVWRWDGGHVALGPAAVGTWQVRVFLHGRDEPAEDDPPLLLTWTGTIRVETGQTTVIRPTP